MLPKKGELLTIAWWLVQTKVLTKGCKDLVVVTDHKPLVKIFGDPALKDTPIFRLKQCTLPWLFEVHYMQLKLI